MRIEHEQVAEFLAECIVRNLDDTDMLPVADLYGMYVIWCEQRGIEPHVVQVFSQAVRLQGLEPGMSRNERVLKGVAATGPIPIQYILETDKGPSLNSAFGALV